MESANKMKKRTRQTMSFRRAIYPGSFDPVTYGHIDLIRRAAHIFDEVTVAVAHNLDKSPLFSVEERVDMLRRVTKGIKGVLIDDFKSLTVDYVRSKNAFVLIRGLRMLSDFEYEFCMALTNRKLDPGIETIFLMPKEEFAYISSTLIKEAVSLGASVSAFVPPPVERELKRALCRT